MTRFFQTTVGANQTSTDCYGDIIWGHRDIDCHFRHFVGFWGIGGFHFDWALFEAISSHDVWNMTRWKSCNFTEWKTPKLLRKNIPCHRVPAKSKGLVRIKIVFLFTVSKIHPCNLKDMDGVLNWSWGFITCSQLLAYGGHDGSTNPWQVDLQVVELQQFWSVEITFESLTVIHPWSAKCAAGGIMTASWRWLTNIQFWPHSATWKPWCLTKKSWQNNSVTHSTQTILVKSQWTWVRLHFFCDCVKFLMFLMFPKFRFQLWTGVWWMCFTLRCQIGVLVAVIGITCPGVEISVYWTCFLL